MDLQITSSHLSAEWMNQQHEWMNEWSEWSHHWSLINEGGQSDVPLGQAATVVCAKSDLHLGRRRQEGDSGCDGSARLKSLDVKWEHWVQSSESSQTVIGDHCPQVCDDEEVQLPKHSGLSKLGQLKNNHWTNTKNALNEEELMKIKNGVFKR